MKVGLLVIATGKYNQFIPPLLKTAKEYFLKNHQVTYYVFTDDKEILAQPSENMVSLYKEHKPWPFPSLSRYEEFYKHKDILSKEDYLFYCDADMLFVSDIAEEILSDRVVTIHPGFCGGRGTPECRPTSTACISPQEELVYYAGGFNGGSSEEFLKMSKIISRNIDIDMKNGVMALWFDESHMNRYFIDNLPTKILSPSYCYPESCHDHLPFKRRLLALDKNHAEMRRGD